MRILENRRLDTAISLILMVLLMLASVVILKHKKAISQYKKYETQFVEAEDWNSANFILRNQICGETFNNSMSTNISNDSVFNGSTIFLLFDNNYCDPCFQTEISRIQEFSTQNTIGLLTTPRNKRELVHLSKTKLKDFSLFGVFNHKTFWTPQMAEFLVYLKIDNGIVTDLLIADESFSSTIDNWLKINTSH